MQKKTYFFPYQPSQNGGDFKLANAAQVRFKTRLSMIWCFRLYKGFDHISIVTTRPDADALLTAT